MTGAKALTKKAGIQTVSIPLRGELEATLETLSSSTPKAVGTLQPNGYRLSESKTGSAPQPGLAPSVSPQPGFREHRQVRRRCAGGPHGAAGRYVKTPGPRINPSAPSGVKSRTTPTCQALAARSPKTTIAILVLAVQAVGQPPVDDPVWNDDDHGHAGHGIEPRRSDRRCLNCECRPAEPPAVGASRSMIPMAGAEPSGFGGSASRTSPFLPSGSASS